MSSGNSDYFMIMMKEQCCGAYFGPLWLQVLIPQLLCKYDTHFSKSYFEIISLSWICAVHHRMFHTLRGYGFDQRIHKYISDRRDSTRHRLTNIWLTQPLPALCAVSCTTWLSYWAECLFCMIFCLFRWSFRFPDLT